MRSFFASLVILGMLAFCAVLNCRYIDSTADKLKSLESSFPEKSEEGDIQIDPQIKQANDIWKKASEKIACTSNLKYVNAVTIAIDNLTDFYCHGSPADYIAARHLFLESLKALRYADSLSLISLI